MGKHEAPKAEAAHAYDVEVVDAASLKPHPKNYKKHPDAQLTHIEASLKQHGFYKNIVVARDGTILAGHGIWEASQRLGYTKIPVHRLGIDPDSPAAMKVLTADNELGRFAETDDRALTEILKDIMSRDDLGLLGTGYDEVNLAALAMVTRPESEIKNFDAAAEWVGMPDFVSGAGEQFILTLQCESAQAREELVAKLGVKSVRKMKQNKIWTGWYPDREQNDLSSVAWTDGDAPAQSTDKE